MPARTHPGASLPWFSTGEANLMTAASRLTATMPSTSPCGSSPGVKSFGLAMISPGHSHVAAGDEDGDWI
jgi:hypothetical protein